MERGACVKAVVRTGQQYMNDSNNNNLTQLQRDLDVLINLTGKGSCLSFFDPRQLLATQCMTLMVNILSKDKTPSTLALKIILFLSNLAYEENIRTALHSTYGLTGCLSHCLKCTDLSDPVKLQCLKLLLKVTYNTRNAIQDNGIEELVTFVLKHSYAKSGEMLELCLGILANLCRHSVSVQTHIRSMSDSKQLYVCLLGHLPQNNKIVMMYALCATTSLWVRDEERCKTLYAPHNIHGTLGLIFNLLTVEQPHMCRKYAADLLMDLLLVPKITQGLVMYKQLEPCIKQVISLISAGDTDTVSKTFELLLAMCAVPKIRQTICRCMIEWSVHGPQVAHSPFLTAIQLSSQSVDTNPNVTLFALRFLKEIYEELLDMNVPTDPQIAANMKHYLEQMLPVLNKILKVNEDHTKYTYSKLCRKKVRAIQLLQTLCVNDYMKTQIGDVLDTTVCSSILEYQALNTQLSFTVSDNSNENFAVGADLVLHLLELMSKVKPYVLNMEEQFTRYLQDIRIVPFLAHGMVSGDREVVYIAGNLHRKTATLDQFPAILFADMVSACNAGRLQELSDNVEMSPRPSKRAMWSYPEDNKENIQFISANGRSSSVEQFNSSKGRSISTGSVEQSYLANTSSHSNIMDVDSALQGLIQKIENDLDLKNVRSSEIIQVYEHQLQSVKTAEAHLQEMLDAKALALAQADRLIAQYRSRKASHEAETFKLRNLIQTLTKSNEETNEQVKVLKASSEQLNGSIDKLEQDNQRLNQIAEQYQELSQAYTAQTQRLENTSRELTALKQDYGTLEEMHGMMKRHNETLKQKHDMACKQLTELEEERKQQGKQLKEKETKLHDTQSQLKNIKDQLSASEKERDGFETAVDKLRKSLDETEKLKKKLQHKVQSLEMVCQQREEEIKAKDVTLAEQKAELDKHGQIVAMIHNLSSGKSN